MTRKKIYYKFLIVLSLFVQDLSFSQPLEPEAKSEILEVEVKQAVIFDWDNTLFPTSPLMNRKRPHQQSTGNLGEAFCGFCDNQEITAFDEKVYAVLSASAETHDVWVVTAANKRWIMMSAFSLPQTFQFLLRLDQAGRLKTRDDTSCFLNYGKNHHFKAIFGIGQMKPSYQKIVSVGDGVGEYEALKLLTSAARPLNVFLRAIRFQVTPSSVYQVFEQLDKLQDSFSMLSLDHLRLNSSEQGKVFHAYKWCSMSSTFKDIPEDKLSVYDQLRDHS
ncbi:MAG: hypothetical protein AB8C84_13290 [Oligoflexales bacterium]